MKPALLYVALIAGFLPGTAAAQTQGLAPESSRSADDCRDRWHHCRHGTRQIVPVDCHRDVRTHRINGVFVRHRHVGEDCAVRVVRQATSK